MRNPELPDALTLTHPPEARAHPRAALPLELDPRQGRLFTLPRAMPTRKLVPAVPQNPRQTALEAASLPQHTQEAIQVATPCPECGDALPLKAKACPNCYTRVTPKGGT